MQVASNTQRVIIARANPGPQTALLTCPIEEIFYGGARGGGKTYGFLLDWIQHSARYGKNAKGIFFRRSYNEMDEVLATGKDLLLPLGATYRAGSRSFFMPNGAVLKLRHLSADSDADKYQGHQYTWMAFDELPNWATPYAINKLRATLRSAAGVPKRLLCSGNPGGPGHNWVKARYIDPAPPYTIFEDEFGEKLVFIPSLLKDNLPLMENDPNYANKLRQSGPEWLVKAWLSGDWDIVAGGMFDDVWSRDVHVVRPFVVPHSWYVDRSYDSGFSHPFAAIWWAESDGTEATLADGVTKWAPPRGTLFAVYEWYGSNGNPNEGINLLAKDIAKGMVEIEKQLRQGLLRNHSSIKPGPADTEIWRADRGKSIADDFKDHGLDWTKADKSPGSRVNGWQRVRALMAESLKDYPEDPCLYVFDTCRGLIRTVPVLPRDPKNPDDVDTRSEDHMGDSVRYRVAKARAEVKVAKLVGL